MESAIILDKSEENIKKCVEQIKQGNLVAFPTETVYGLGANALDVDACMKIYQYKKRPLTDPLIVHIAENDQIWELIDIDKKLKEKIEILIQLFWPGPFTMVLPRSQRIPVELTAQTNYIGIRRPDHQTALQFLKKCNLPIAAPSANLFNHVSPTTAQHVYKDFHNKSVLILDDGQTTLGIESTVVKVEINKLTFFRLGSLPIDAIKNILKEKQMEFEIEVIEKKQEETQNCETPGQFIKHYSPDIESFLLTENKNAKLIDKSELKECILIDFGCKYLSYHDKVLKYLDLSDQGSFKQAILAENVENAKKILIIDLTEALDQCNQKELMYFDTLYDKMIRSCSGNYIKINQVNNLFNIPSFLILIYFLLKYTFLVMENLQEIYNSNTNIQQQKNVSKTSQSSIPTYESKKGVIFINPSGEIFYGENINSTNNPSLQDQEEKQKLLKQDNLLKQFINNQNLTQYSNQEHIRILIQRYQIHAKIFMILILLSVLNVIDFAHRQSKIRDRTFFILSRFYKQVNLSNIVTIYWSIYCLEVIYNIVFLVIAICCIKKKSIKYYDIFNLLCLFGGIVQMFQAYIQEFNFTAFTMRLFLFYYSKYICEILIQLISTVFIQQLDYFFI